MRIRIVERIAEIDARSWNALGATPYPFLRHEFLAALEEENCLGERYGWLPRHLSLWDADDRLLGAAPLYLKFNSYGEFVFDWAWADAYERNGLKYYPKLVSASPYTPATGPKLLIHPDAPTDAPRLLMAAGLELAQQLEVSSLHWLFTMPGETDALEAGGLMRRIGCQFHWQNQGYEDFDAFLATLTSAKRKNIRKERKRVAESGIRFRLLDGKTAGDGDWATFHALYESTFHRRGGIPTLSLDFFRKHRRNDARGRAAGHGRLRRCCGRRRLLPGRRGHPLWEALGLLRAIRQAALRGLLLPGPGILHPAWPGTFRTRGPG